MPVRGLDTAKSNPKSPKPTSPAVNFTFVNQADDVVSLAQRKVNDANQRHAIRSHVMQRVRQEELAQGKRRPSGRDHPKRAARVPIRSRSGDSDSNDRRTSVSHQLVEVGNQNQSGAWRILRHENGKSPSGRRKIPRNKLQLSIAPAVHEFDPFQTLPVNGVPHKSVESMLAYCA